MWQLLRPYLFTLDPETAHDLAFFVMENTQRCCWVRQILSQNCSYQHPVLHQNVFGLNFPNPVGLAAGFDKDARLLPAWDSLGFGFAEIGTITPLPQPGNPQPRLFRLPADEAIINRMGFN